MANLQNPHPLTVAEQWAKAGRAVALATVVDTWSSAPLPTGSQMVVDADGNIHGSLSSGCVEADVTAAAMGIVAGDKPRLLDFSVTDATALAAGLSCGGRIQIYIERIS